MPLYALAGDLDRLVDVHDAQRWATTHDLPADVVPLARVTELLAAELNRQAHGVWRAEVEADDRADVVSTGLHLPLLSVTVDERAVATWGAPGAIVGARRLDHGGLDRVAIAVAAELARRGRTTHQGLMTALREIGHHGVTLEQGGGVGLGQLAIVTPAGTVAVAIDHFGAQWTDPEHGLQRFPLGDRQALAELISGTVHRLHGRRIAKALQDADR